MPPEQDADNTRTEVARKVGIIPDWPVELPLLLPTAAVVPLVPVAGFVVAGWLELGRPLVPTVAVLSGLSIMPVISTRCQ